MTTGSPWSTRPTTPRRGGRHGHPVRPGPGHAALRPSTMTQGRGWSDRPHRQVRLGCGVGSDTPITKPRLTSVRWGIGAEHRPARRGRVAANGSWSAGRPVSGPEFSGDGGMRTEATSIMACMSSATERRSKLSAGLAPLVGPCPRCDLADTLLHEIPADRGEGEGCDAGRQPACRDQDGHGVAGRSVSSPACGGDGGGRIEATSIAGHRAPERSMTSMSSAIERRSKLDDVGHFDPRRSRRPHDPRSPGCTTVRWGIGAEHRPVRRVHVAVNGNWSAGRAC
jgi:hypothetical protein